MFNQQLFKKPKDVRYVDMAIWIDNNFYKEDCDYNKAYTFMWLIAYMLACKAKYFNSKNDYEEFASILAYSTYQRMIDKDKVQIKSVLNYMKSIMYFRKAAYEAQRHQEVFDSEFNNWDQFAFSEKLKSQIERSNHDKIVDGIIDVLKEIPGVIKSNIPKVFRSDKVLYRNIYISCLLSMLNKATLPKVSEEYLEMKLNINPAFNITKYYLKHLDDNIILWHLQSSMETVVRMIINKTNRYLVDEIKGLSNSINISEDEFNGIIASSFISGGKNDEANY